jgi:ElaB/YqjD/DUF883 family membrane-anchored ribosome-binding protein
MDLRAQDQESGSAASGGSSPQTGVLSTAASTVHDVLEQAESAAVEAQDKVKPVVSRLPQAAQAPIYEAVHAAADAASTLTERADDFMEEQQQLLDSATAYVRANPLQSVGLAFAAGWLIGKLTR